MVLDLLGVDETESERSRTSLSTVIKLIFEGWLPHCLSFVGSCLGLGNAGWLPHNAFEGSPFRAILGRSRSVSSWMVLGGEAYFYAARARASRSTLWPIAQMNPTNSLATAVVTLPGSLRW